MASYEGRILHAAEAQQLVDFVDQVYQGSYPSDLFTSADNVAQLIEQQLLYPSVIFNSQGDIIAHLAVLFEDEQRLTADSITGMVLPGYRGENLMVKLAGPILPLYQSLAGQHLYPVTFHTISQRKTIDNGGIACGTLLADWPGQLSIEGFESPENLTRMPMSCVFYPFNVSLAPRRDCFLPPAYQETIAGLYQSIGFERTLQVNDVFAASHSTCQTIEKPRQGTITLRLLELGRDCQQLVEQFNQVGPHYPARYIDVPITQPGAGQLLDWLRTQGWYYGGLLPERHGCDLLRMQCSELALDLEAVQMVDAIKAMATFVLRDRDEVSST